MDPTIALIACLIFILIVFVQEVNDSKKVTNAVWLPFFWMVICASRSIGQWLNIGSKRFISDADFLQASMSGSPVDKVVLSVVIAWGIIIIYKRGLLAEIFKNNKLVLLFVVYMGVTFLWSDIGIVSIKRWVRLFGHFVMAGVLISEPEPFESIKSVFKRTAYLLVPLSILWIKYFRHLGVVYTKGGGELWTGVAVMKNGLGHLSFVFSFFFIWYVMYTWKNNNDIPYSRALFDLIVLIMGLWLLLAPDNSSAASLSCLILGVTMIIGLKFSVIKRNIRKMGFFIILAVCLFYVLESSFDIVELVVTSLGRNMTFTDRVPVWTVLTDIGLKKAILGYGYSSFWTAERLTLLPEEVGTFTQAHSGYLELFLEGGVVAIILLGVLLISVFRKILISGMINYEYAVFRISFLAMILLANVTESALARERDLLSFVFFIIVLNDKTLMQSLTDCTIKSKVGHN